MSLPATTPKQLDEKLARMANGTAKRSDFILADAKDADMAFGIAATGPRSGNSPTTGFRTLPEYRESIREVVRQGLVDLVLMSASTVEQLAIEEKLFENSHVTSAARANDTTDIWIVRGGSYASQPSHPFRSADIDHIKYGQLEDDFDTRVVGADLGLYSLTFTNQLEADLRTLEQYRAFRLEAERKQFRHFLEVFNPNIAAGLAPGQVGGFLNDHIVRCLAGITSKGRPLFLKIPYNGPAALEELASYDPQLVVGILGGSAGTTLDAFQLLHDAQKYGARVALFGRKINHAEDPLAFIQLLRRLTDGEISPVDAVRDYHATLSRTKVAPKRSLEDDLQLTTPELRYS